MAERPSFRRPGPEKRCKHLGAPFTFSAGAEGSGARSRFASGTAGSGEEGTSSADVVGSRSHLPFDLPPPFFLVAAPRLL
eukprot:9912510-Alexandrium_andersonii.AAC.1